jgi:hypothetical protein
MPDQLWDLIFWLGVILAIDLCVKDLLKWFYKYFIEDKGREL